MVHHNPCLNMHCGTFSMPVAFVGFNALQVFGEHPIEIETRYELHMLQKYKIVHVHTRNH